MKQKTRGWGRDRNFGVPMKVITVSGSLRFEAEIRAASERLELLGNCVLGVTYTGRPDFDKESYTKWESATFDRAHKQRIAISDALYVVNPGGYIGSSTRSELEYARKLGLEILSLEPLD